MRPLLPFLLLTQLSHAQLDNIPAWNPLPPSTSSTALRQNNRSYIHSIEFAQPTPATTAVQLTALNPHLPKILPHFDLARSSDWFLPETAYSWHNSGGTENPFLTYYPETLAKLQELRTQLEANAKTDPGVVWREMIKSCDDQIYRVRERGLHNSTKSNLRNRRFLLADRDPFVVLPVPWVNKDAAFSPKMGDYAAVIHGNKIYPAILGDAGPSDKVGEASLRLARELNPKANGRTRAISDLTVTYLFFPKSATKAQTPDLALWHQNVSALLKEIGGLGEGITLHAWNVSPSP